jgi:hypothetical protein
MNLIQRIAAAAAVSAAAIAPATSAFAEPYPWHENPGAAQPTKPKAQVEYEERLRMNELRPEPFDDASASDVTGFPWDTVGLAALGAGALAAGGAAVVRRSHRVPRHA